MDWLDGDFASDFDLVDEEDLMSDTFECAWCKMSNPDEPELFTHDVIFIGGHDVETGLPICDGCANAGDPVSSDD